MNRADTFLKKKVKGKVFKNPNDGKKRISFTRKSYHFAPWSTKLDISRKCNRRVTVSCDSPQFHL